MTKIDAVRAEMIKAMKAGQKERKDALSALLTALKNVAMQIAAMNPEYISRADISTESLAKLKEITI